jgi:hypothetical protein
MMLYCIGVYIANVFVNRNMDISATLSASDLYVLNEWGDYYIYLSTLFPCIVVFPFAFSNFEDKTTKISFLFQTRMGNRNYYYSQMIVCFLGTFALFFIPVLANAILTHLTFFETGNTYYGFIYTHGYCASLLGTDVFVNTSNIKFPFLKLFILNPFIYNILYTFLFGVFAGIFGVFNLACSYYLKRFKISLFFINYLIFYAGSMIDSLLGQSEQYVDTLFLDYVSVGIGMGKSIWFIVISCTVLLIFSILSMRRVMTRDKL